MYSGMPVPCTKIIGDKRKNINKESRIGGVRGEVHNRERSDIDCYIDLHIKNNGRTLFGLNARPCRKNV